MMEYYKRVIQPEVDELNRMLTKPIVYELRYLTACACGCNLSGVGSEMMWDGGRAFISLEHLAEFRQPRLELDQ